jgi:hypothetical protein
VKYYTFDFKPSEQNSEIPKDQKKKSIFTVKKKETVSAAQESTNEIEIEANKGFKDIKLSFAEELEEVLKKEEERKNRRKSKKKAKQAQYLSKAEEFDAIREEFLELKKRDKLDDEDEDFENLTPKTDDYEYMQVKEEDSNVMKSNEEDYDSEEDVDYVENDEIDPLEIESSDNIKMKEDLDDEEDAAAKIEEINEIEEDLDDEEDDIGLDNEVDESENSEEFVGKPSNSFVEISEIYDDLYELKSLKKSKKSKKARKSKSYKKWGLSKQDLLDTEDDEDLIVDLQKETKFDKTSKKNKKPEIDDLDDDLMRDINEEDDENWDIQGEDLNLEGDGHGNYQSNEREYEEVSA